MVFFHDDMNRARWIGPVVPADPCILATRRITPKLAKSMGQRAGLYATGIMLECLGCNLRESRICNHWSNVSALLMPFSRHGGSNSKVLRGCRRS